MIELEHITQRTNLGFKEDFLDRKFKFMFDNMHIIKHDKKKYILFTYKEGKHNTYTITDMTLTSTLVLSTYVEKNHEYVRIVEASKKNKFPAVKLYSFIIKKLGKTLVTSEQSYGGIRLWQKLSRVRGVNIHGWDFKKNKVVNTDKYLRDIDDLYVNRTLSKYHKDIANVHLVASSIM